jgi:hypothetical protein
MPGPSIFIALIALTAVVLLSRFVVHRPLSALIHLLQFLAVISFIANFFWRRVIAKSGIQDGGINGNWSTKKVCTSAMHLHDEVRQVLQRAVRSNGNDAGYRLPVWPSRLQGQGALGSIGWGGFMASADLNARRANRHIQVLGTCWVVYGVVRIIASIWLFFFSNVATVMFGALLGRVPDPFTMMALFHVIYGLVIILSLICGVLGILAGWSLLSGQTFGRTLAVVVGILSLSDIPLGLTLGIYDLIILLPKDVQNTVLLKDPAADSKEHASTM